MTLPSLICSNLLLQCCLDSHQDRDITDGWDLSILQSFHQSLSLSAL